MYPRLTTKSNTFTVHVRVQALKQGPATAAGTWTDGKDVIAGVKGEHPCQSRFCDPVGAPASHDPQASTWSPCISQTAHWSPPRACEQTLRHPETGFLCSVAGSGGTGRDPDVEVSTPQTCHRLSSVSPDLLRRVIHGVARL